VFLGGAGDDQITMAIADLTAGDRFDGGAGRDRITFTTAGTLTAASLSGVSGIETLSLSSAGANRVTLPAHLDGTLVAGGSGADTVTLGAASQFVSLGAGDDTLVVRAGTVPALSSYGKEGTDLIRTQGGGTFVFGPGIVEFERLSMQNAATIDLTASVMALQVTGSTGADIVRVGTLAQTLALGAGDDAVLFAAATGSAHVVRGFTAGGNADRLGFAADAFPLAAGHQSIVLAVDASTGGAIGAGIGIVVRQGLADAAAVDAYLAAAGAPAGGILVVATAGAGGNAAIYFDPDATGTLTGQRARLIATLHDLADPAALAASDFFFF
jgi:hypothetical protein